MNSRSGAISFIANHSKLLAGNLVKGFNNIIENQKHGKAFTKTNGLKNSLHLYLYKKNHPFFNSVAFLGLIACKVGQ